MIDGRSPAVLMSVRRPKLPPRVRRSWWRPVGSAAGGGSVEVVAELLAPAGVPQLRQRLGLDLADPLAGQAELAPDLVEGAGLAIDEAEAHLDDGGFAVGQGAQDLVELLLHQAVGHDFGRDRRVGVLDEVTEVAVLVVTDGRLERDWLARVALDLDDLLGRHVELLGEL